MSKPAKKQRTSGGVSFLCAIFTILFCSSFEATAKEKHRLVYFDGHMHTTRSDGSGTVADIKETALSKGLDVVIVTDHCRMLTSDEWDELASATDAVSDESFLALPGVEMDGKDGLQRDHFLAYGIDDPFVGDDDLELCPDEVWESPSNPDGTGPLYPQHLTRWVDYIHSQGGIAVHAHTLGATLPEYGVNNIEIFNPGTVEEFAEQAVMMGYEPFEAWQLGMTINNLGIYGERDINKIFPFPGFPDGLPLRYGIYLVTEYVVPPYVGQWLGAPEAPLNSWDELLMAYVDGLVDTPMFALANSDAHDTGQPDSRVGEAKNGVYVKQVTAGEFYKAIKAGRSFATTGPSLKFDVNGEWMGDTARIPSGERAKINLSVTVENEKATLVKIDIIKNGYLWQTIYPMSETYQALVEDDKVSGDGYYRIEVTSCAEDFDSDVECGGGYYFAWSNPVFFHVD